MPVKINSSGVPSNVSTAGLTADLANAVTPIETPQPNNTSFGQVIADLMLGLSDEALVVLDPNRRKVYCATNSQDALRTKFNDAHAAAKRSVLTPDNGQTGTALTFTAANGGSVAASVSAIAEILTAPVKPKRSVSSIVAAVLAQAYDEGKAPVVVIDQFFSTVTLVEPTSASSDALEELVDEANVLTVSLTGTDTTVPSPTTKLVFEGGAV